MTAAKARLSSGHGHPTSRLADPPLHDAAAVDRLSAQINAVLAAGHPQSLADLLAIIARPQFMALFAPGALRSHSREFQGAANRLSLSIAEAIDRVSNAPTLLTALAEASGKTALMLSGGGKLGNYHLGVVRTLLDADLLPDIVSGASAGAIIAAIIGTSRSDALAEVLANDARELSADGHSGAKAFYDSPFSQQRLQDMIERLIPDWTFAEARAYSGRQINIVIAEATRGGGGRILNADVAPDVLLRDAVCASCAVPFVYSAVMIRERTGNQPPRPYADGARWIDGSVHADLPATWLRDHYCVSRLIASVVNPLELPLLTDPDIVGAPAHEAISGAMNLWRLIGAASLDLLTPMLPPVPPVTRAVDLSRRVIDQKVEADIIIAPAQRIHGLTQMAEHARADELAAFIAEGEKAARGRLAMIAPAVRIERAISRAQCRAI